MDFKQRLYNWVRCYKSTHLEPISCGSLESNFKSTEIWQPTQSKEEPDRLDAKVVEDEVVKLPDKFKMILKYAYMTPTYNYRGFLRKSKIQNSQFNDTLKQAENMLENSLNKLLTR